MGYKEFLNGFSVTPVGAWIAKTINAKIDPFFYRISGGRFTSSGPLTIPQLTLTTIGRKSGKERTVQLGYHPVGGDVLIVASNFGGKNHPAWSYNLDANPGCTIRIGAEDKQVTATRLTDEEKAAVWPKIERTIPQMKTYKTRTTRNIKVYRLRA
jgi:deazaflavin-dependent oxidoreductase (nitroreductase family)